MCCGTCCYCSIDATTAGFDADVVIGVGVAGIIALLMLLLLFSMLLLL